MDKRVGPWINKKIVEYIGEEEPTLTDFICNKVGRVCWNGTMGSWNFGTMVYILFPVSQLACHIPAEEILKDIAMVSLVSRFHVSVLEYKLRIGHTPMTVLLFCICRYWTMKQRCSL